MTTTSCEEASEMNTTNTAADADSCVRYTLEKLLDRLESEWRGEIDIDAHQDDEDNDAEEDEDIENDDEVEDMLEEEDETKSVELGQLEGEVMTSKLVDDNNNSIKLETIVGGELSGLFLDRMKLDSVVLQEHSSHQQQPASSTHTFRKTEWDVKKLETFVRHSYGDTTRLEKIEPQKLSIYLKGFFEHAQKTDGMEYEPESLIGFMNSFERFLRARHYPESLLRSDLFKECRVVLKRKRELVRSIGRLVRIKSKDTFYVLLYHRNLLKERGLLNRDNPDTLLAEIYLNNKIYFGDYLKEDKAWRGNLNLVWGDLLLERDPDNGLEYLTLSIPASKKSLTPCEPATLLLTSDKLSNIDINNNNNNNTSSNKLSLPRVYARQPALACPVEAYKAYKSRRPANCLDQLSPFYLAPNSRSKPHSKTWYKVLAMSCQRLDALFYCLFKKAQLNLNGLVSMSEKEQQHIVASAMITSQANNDIVVWKTATIPTSSPNTVATSFVASKTQTQGSRKKVAALATPIASAPTSGHPVTRGALPIKVQVQVQVQVKLPQHSKEQSTNRAMAAAAAAAAANTTSAINNSFPSFKIQLPFKLPVK